MKIRSGFVSNSSSSSYIVDISDSEIKTLVDMLEKYVRGIDVVREFDAEELEQLGNDFEIPMENIVEININWNGGEVYLKLPQDKMHVRY